MRAPAAIPKRRAMKGSTLKVLIRSAKIQEANAIGCNIISCDCDISGKTRKVKNLITRDSPKTIEGSELISITVDFVKP